MVKVPFAKSKGSKLRKSAKYLLVAAIFCFTFFGGVYFGRYLLEIHGRLTYPLKLGATFSIHYAEDLGINWRDAYLAMLDELEVKRVRIPAYWDIIQPREDTWDFSALDWQIRQAEERNVEVILAVGRKLPRWPECHVPKWANGLTEEEVQPLILDLVRQTVSRYASSSAVVAWQVENEPFFHFGNCPAPDYEMLKREVKTVESVDYRPVIVTDSGELSTWIRAAYVADVLGISTYRVVWSSLVGYFHWPILPQTYFHKSLLIRPLVDGVFISELQAEPWSAGQIINMPMNLQMEQMNPSRLRNNIEFARQTGVLEVYLWGVEWWYYAREKGHPEMWNTGVKIIEQENAYLTAKEKK